MAPTIERRLRRFRLVAAAVSSACAVSPEAIPDRRGLVLRGLRLRLRASRRRVISRERRPLYNAFLSYSHEADSWLAPKLRSALHGFARSWNQVRALRVFVDNANLAANPGLWPAIEEAMDASEFFLLLASRRAADSPYVLKEAAHWRESKPVGSVLIALTDGEIAWDDAEADFDWKRTTALPSTLRGAFPTEPRWVDLRWASGAESLSLRDNRFRDAVADLAATLHHRDKDELAGDDVRLHRRATLLFRGAAAALAALAAATTVAAVLFLGERNAAREQTRIALSRQLAAQSQLARDGRIDRALLLGVAAVRVRSTVEARSALFGALEREPRLLRELWGEGAVSSPIVFVPGSRLVAAGNDRGDVTLWDGRSGRRVRTLRSKLGVIYGLSVSLRGRFIVGTGEGGLVVWDLRGKTPTGRSLPAEEIAATAFSPDGRLATTSSDGSIWIWDKGLKRSRQLTGPRGTTSAMAFDATGRRLLTAGHNGPAQIWSTRRRRPPRNLALPRSGGGFVSVAWHENKLAAGTEGGRIARWDVRHPDVVRMLGRPGRQVSSVAFSPDGRVLAAADGASVSLWSAEDGGLIQRFATSGQPLSVAFSPSGSELATGGEAGSVVLWSRTVRLPLTRGLHVPRGVVTALAFDSDGGIIAAGTDKGAVLTWDARSGKLLPTPPAGRDEVWALGFGPHGGSLAAGYLGGSVRLLDPRHGRDIRPARQAGVGIDSVAVGRTGTLLAAGGHGMLWSWPVGARRARARRVVPDSTQTSLSTDGSAGAFSAGDGTVVLWDVAHRRNLSRTLRADFGQAVDVVLAPLGDAVAVAGVRSISVWDTRSGERRVGPLTATTDLEAGIVEVAVSDGAKTLATGDSEGNIVVWDGVAGVSLGAPLDVGKSGTRALALSRDGGRLAIAGGPGVLLTTLDEHDWQRRACGLANRGLTPAERREVGRGGAVSVRELDPCGRSPHP